MADLVGGAVIGNPERAVLVGMRAPRHPVRPGQIVLDIDDLHRLIAERPHLALVLRQVGRRLRQLRILAEHRVDVIDDVLGLLVVEAEDGAVDEVAHRLAHVVDAAAPAVLVADHRRHAALEAVAGHAVGEQQVLAAPIGQELLALVHGDVAPAHIALRQREILGGVLVDAERDAALRIGLVADRAHGQPIVAGRQILDRVLALVVRQHAGGDLGLGVLRLDEGAAERLAVGPGDRAGDRRRIRRRNTGGHCQAEANAHYRSHDVPPVFDFVLSER